MLAKKDFIKKFIVVIEKYLIEELPDNDTFFGFVERSWIILKRKVEENFY